MQACCVVFIWWKNEPPHLRLKASIDTSARSENIVFSGELVEQKAEKIQTDDSEKTGARSKR